LVEFCMNGITSRVKLVSPLYVQARVLRGGLCAQVPYLLQLESCWWVPLLFGVAGIILGVSFPLLDDWRRAADGEVRCSPFGIWFVLFRLIRRHSHQDALLSNGMRMLC